MRLPRAISIGAVACGMAITIWSLSRLLMSPILPRTTPPAKTAATLPRPAASADPRLEHLAPHQRDPSVDPEVLARAFAPPPANLPAKARPKPSNIHPSPREWKRLQEQHEVVAY